MAFRRRGFRRKPRVIWLPILGNARGDGESVSTNALGERGSLSNGGAINTNEIVFDAFAVTFDQPIDQDTLINPFGGQDFTLHDIASGNAFRLRRLVGKFFVEHTTDPGTRQLAVDVAMGFIVCRTDSDGFPVTDFSEVNPLASRSSEDPWIWRRRWVLGYGEAGGTIAGVNTFFPRTNAQYGSVADGPHIDQKTARVISNDERLFCVIAAQAIDVTDPADTFVINYTLDLRLLASLRMQQGNRRNASR